MDVGDHRDLLDLIDRLRSQGVSHYIDLPEIIVCGDQSAGKSSVLEAISGRTFPIKDGLCTRFATELILRRSQEEGIKVSIIPGETRVGDDKERLERWQPRARVKEDGLKAVTDEAKQAMATDSSSTGDFFQDTLRIELTGPEMPHLTMVDLPGLFRRGSTEQSADDVSMVRGMVEKYMARPRSIILAVVSAKNDYVLQEVTSMANRADPKGRRTMGLITKPDTLDVGSSTETHYVRLAQNLESELHLGWHTLRNRSFEEQCVSSAQRDETEKSFFSQGLWNCVDPSDCGVGALREKLSKVLRDQILSELPHLVSDVEDGLRDCSDRLERLGPPRNTPQEQLGYLVRVSDEYTSLMMQAVEGTYTHQLFGGRREDRTFYTRLRAVVQNHLVEFARNMRSNGQNRQIVDSDCEEESDVEVSTSIKILRSDYVKDVAKSLKYSKGRELPGLFNPLIVSDLFVEQCEPWKGIVMTLATDILEAAVFTTRQIIEKITASDITENILELVDKKIQELHLGMVNQIHALLPSAAQHPITYNPQLTENVRKIKQARQNRLVKAVVAKIFGPYRFAKPDSTVSINPIQLVDLVQEVDDSDMDQYGSSLAVDYMQAYYKVAVERFIDGVSILAVENCLISKLPTLLKSHDVVKMTSVEISFLVEESRDTSLERERLKKKRGILADGLQTLRSLQKRSNFIEFQTQDDVTSQYSGQASDVRTSATVSVEATTWSVIEEPGDIWGKVYKG
ncbi:unnamed protein product [Fusarium venenatum]|uniref:GED domain-containing protein n=1 Tax=Fusarium venenatum TaxID=56646 RepID=A0A2L2TQH6_9HYPO|nr:uncharacterized protein FVRRES_08258 [Fusarium venenatum]KAH6965049.1 P-loop containing nucleoside triphosphate hydrolase protein [Fusarium venenatum]CEI68181.1 unnamed protein product [Fusarium venenatum]